MLSRLSIRARLTAGFAAALVLVLAMTALFVYVHVGNELDGALDDAVRSRADDLSALVAGTGQDGPKLGGDLLSRGGEDFAKRDEDFSQIFAPTGKLISSTLVDPKVEPLDPVEVARAAVKPVWFEPRKVPGIEGEVRILARPVTSPDEGKLVVVTGSTTHNREEALAGLTRAFLIGAPAALLLACGIGYLLAGRSLAPVEAMRRRAGQITLERSGERLPLPRADDEIHRLGETLNTMLDRIEASLERERVFVSDASHELRTPLATLKTELELADRHGLSEERLRAALRSAGEEVDRLSQLAEDLLVIARSDQGRLPIAREGIELKTLLERVRERFAHRAGESGREIIVDADGAGRVELDPLRIEQALGNLVDNALRYGEGEVQLGARRDGDRVVFEVTDQGPGFPREFEPQAFERFSRADGGRTGEGTGLGLAIARAIAVAHGGEIAILNGFEPRGSVRITVPAQG